jgi:pilus assembly protein CpaC
MINQNKPKDVRNSYARRLLRSAALLTAAGAMVLATTGSAAGQTPAPTTRPAGLITDGVGADGLHLITGKSAVITLQQSVKDFGVKVTNPDVAGCMAMSPTTLLVTAKKPGTTSIVVFDGQERVAVVDVTVDPDFTMLTHQIKQAFPTLDISVTPLADTIALHGQVPSMQVSEQIVEMAGTYGKVHNFLDISGGQQVMLQVRLAEVSKSALRNLGVTFGGTDNSSTFSTNGIGPGANTFTFPPAAGASPLSYSVGGNIFGTGRFGNVSFDYLITALRTNNLLRDLAEPNLLTSSGQEASFLAGGQIPIPVPQPGNGGSTITIQYVQYGVQLKFTPNVLGNGKIRLHVAPEVSQLDYSHAVEISGYSVPGFTDRKVETTVELGDGQSLALAGLLQNDMSESVSRIPGLGDLPVLGALFRSTTYSRDETELVVMVTPRLQAPLNPDQVPLLPGEHWRYPNTLQQFIRADMGGPAVEHANARADSKSDGPPPQFHGQYGFTAAGTGSVGPVEPAPAK